MRGNIGIDQPHVFRGLRPHQWLPHQPDEDVIRMTYGGRRTKTLPLFLMSRDSCTNHWRRGFPWRPLALSIQVVTFLHSHDILLLTLYTCLLFNPFIVVHPPGATLTRRHKSSVLIVETFNLHEPSLCTRGSEKTVIADDR